MHASFPVHRLSRHEEAFPDDVRVRMPDTRKAAEVLGFAPSTPLEAMVDEVIGWVREMRLSTADA
ncbi:hypothetical protein ACZ90_10165 [Streptomyces albus subsp. albus]|nr:hypothetical protein ACZ90_10165 [Streptomyces albus subsp. albus]